LALFRLDAANCVDSPPRAAYTRPPEPMPSRKTAARKRAARKGTRPPARSAPAELTSLLAANLLFEILCLVA